MKKNSLTYILHLWISIPFGIFICAICLSGAILVFEKEIMETIYPSRYFVKSEGKQPLSPEQIMTSARNNIDSDIDMTGLRIHNDPNRSYEIIIPGKNARAFVNQYTGNVLYLDDGKHFFFKTMRFHRWFFENYKRGGGFSISKTIVGYSTLLFIVIIITGLILWYPKNMKMLKNRLRIRVTKGWKNFLYDIHVSGGFYLSLVLIILSVTGLTYSFTWAKDAVYFAFGATPKTTSNTKVDNSHQVKGIKNEKNSESKEVNYIAWNDVLAEIQHNNANYKSILIQDGTANVKTKTYGNVSGADKYIFDKQTGEITSFDPLDKQPLSSNMRGWLYAFHVGTVGGVFGKIVVFVASLAGGIAPIWGYYYWIKSIVKKRRRKGLHLYAIA